VSALPHFSAFQWLLAFIAAISIGIAKSGFGGLGMVTVLLMAEIMPARESTGVVLPLLIFGDVLAVGAFRRHTQWRYIVRMLLPAALGIVIGYFLMAQKIPDRVFRLLIGLIILALATMQFFRKTRPDKSERVPHRPCFASLTGIAAGATTMLANAAGPIMSLYLLAANLPKWEFVGTAAMFFLVVNLVKVPFSAHLGLINGSSLSFNVALFPAVALGIYLGRALLKRIPQNAFEQIVLIFTALASARLIIQSL